MADFTFIYFQSVDEFYPLKEAWHDSPFLKIAKNASFRISTFAILLVFTIVWFWIFWVSAGKFEKLLSQMGKIFLPE